MEKFKSYEPVITNGTGAPKGNHTMKEMEAGDWYNKRDVARAWLKMADQNEEAKKLLDDCKLELDAYHISFYKKDEIKEKINHAISLIAP